MPDNQQISKRKRREEIEEKRQQRAAKKQKLSDDAASAPTTSNSTTTTATRVEDLPQDVKILFTPRPPLPWAPPTDYAPKDRRTPQVGGIAQFMSALQQHKEEFPADTEQGKKDDNEDVVAEPAERK